MAETRPRGLPFWDIVDTSGGLDACWPWTGGKGKGYGKILRRGMSESLAHRYAYSLAHPHEPMPEAVMHECDNPPCCNPLHLTGGTRAENNRQAAERGLTASGERQGHAKLTDEQVREIRELRASGKPGAEIAALYGVTRGHVYHLANGWKRAA